MFALLLALGAVAASGCARSAPAQSNGAASPRATAIGNRGPGAEIFRANCAVCHAPSGAAAGVGPALAHERRRKNYEQTVAWIESPDPPMPKLYPSPLSERDVADVAAYVQSL